jgi:type IV secretion system protein TrbJ
MNEKKRKYRNGRRAAAFIALMAILFFAPTASRAQFGFGGIVYDPTNYRNAVLRYLQMQQQLAQLRQTYEQVSNQYQLALAMSQNLENMEARYRATFSEWRSFSANDLYGNTTRWISAVNGAGTETVSSAYQLATIPLLTYNADNLNVINSADARNFKSTYASLELADGASVSALTTVGNIRANASAVEQHIANLEQDSLSSDPALGSRCPQQDQRLERPHASHAPRREQPSSCSARTTGPPSETRKRLRRRQSQLRDPDARAGHEEPRSVHSQSLSKSRELPTAVTRAARNQEIP